MSFLFIQLLKELHSFLVNPNIMLFYVFHQIFMDIDNIDNIKYK